MPVRFAWLNLRSGIRWFLTITFWAFVNLLMFFPSRELPDAHLVPMQDKIIHLVIFAVLAAMVRWSIPNPWGRGSRILAVVLMLMTYGVATECVQALLTNAGRTFEWSDIAMDSIGVVAGWWICGRLAIRPALASPDAGFEE